MGPPRSMQDLRGQAVLKHNYRDPHLSSKCSFRYFVP